MKKTIYISGKMTGIKDFNRPAFENAEQALLCCGYEAFSPHKNGLSPDAPYEDHMAADLAAIEKCDGVALLPCWVDSPGAKREVAHAEKHNKIVRSISYWITREAKE
jgi:hypothetical protein